MKLLLLTLLFAVCGLAAPAQMPQSGPPIGPGVSHDLAVWRAAHYSDICYKLDLTLEKMSPVLKGTIEIHVKVTQPGSVPPAVAGGAVSPIILDWRRLAGHEKDSTVSNITINGVSALLDPDLRLLELTPNGPERAFYESNEHLVFRDGVVAGENIIKLDFTSPILTNGSAIMRQVDKDGSEYIYSHFTHGNVNTAFPSFDQPDLKASFQLKFYLPDEWKAISNTDGEYFIEQSWGTTGQSRDWTIEFKETKPISIYDFRFKAGPKK